MSASLEVSRAHVVVGCSDINRIRKSTNATSELPMLTSACRNGGRVVVAAVAKTACVDRDAEQLKSSCC